MYRFLFRPKWLFFHLLVVTGIVSMLLLGKWQWTKYGARNDFVAKVHSRENATPSDLGQRLAAGDTAAAIEYSRVTASGSYLPGDQFSLINQAQGADTGVDVLTAFQITGGPVVIVNRGFVNDGATVPAPPAGTLLIGGTARVTQVRGTGELTDNGNGSKTEVRRVDVDLISSRLGTPVAPVFIDFIASKPTSPSPPYPVPLPDLSGGPPYLSYSIQWCIFSTCVAVGWVFAVRRSLRTRRRAAANEAGAANASTSADDDDRQLAVSEASPVQPSA